MKIIYEDEDLLAINKPAGLLVHGTRISNFQFPIFKQIQNSKLKIKNLEDKTLVDWLINKYPEIKDVGDPSTGSEQANLRPGIVHRLDKDTSGILLAAKNQKAFEFLKAQFKERKIKKTYIALVQGKIHPAKYGTKGPPMRTGKIETPIKRFSKTRDAETEYKVLKVFPEVRLQNAPKSDFKNYTLLEVSPKTGRKHQIRLHLKSIGHPIVCEKLYSRKPHCPFGLKRHFLHAQTLEFNLPDGSRIKLEADLPEDLQTVLNLLEEYDRKEK